ncbi:MAG: hypothetical protein ACFFCD_01555 [Promethearchaeota archaeon]
MKLVQTILGSQSQRYGQEVFKIKYIDVIDKIYVPHCARGPKRCEECKKATEVEKICLIRVYLESSDIARPMSDFVVDGKKMLCEFDVLKVFEDESEAEGYAKKHNINILAL